MSNSLERVLLMILALIQFTHIMDFMIMMPLGPQLMDAFDIDPQQFSLLVASYSISAAVSGLAAVFFLDNFDRKVALQWVYAGFALGTLACGFADSYELLMVTRCITGLFGGVLGALVLSIIGDVIPVERRAGAMGVVMAAFSVASVVGVPAGLYFAAKLNWHAPFWALGGLSVLILIGIVALVPPVKGHLQADGKRNSPLKTLQLIFTDPNQVSALAFTIVLMLGHFTIIPFIAPYMVKNIGFTEENLSLIYLAGGALTLVTSPIIGRIADRVGKVQVFTFFGVAAAIPIFLITNLPPVGLVIALIVTSSFFVVATGRMIPATTLVTSVVKPETRGSFMSMRTVSQQLGSGLASLIGGMIVSTAPVTEKIVDYPYAGYFAIVFSLLAVPIGRRLKIVA